MDPRRITFEWLLFGGGDGRLIRKNRNYTGKWLSAGCLSACSPMSHDQVLQTHPWIGFSVLESVSWRSPHWTCGKVSGVHDGVMKNQVLMVLARQALWAVGFSHSYVGAHLGKMTHESWRLRRIHVHFVQYQSAVSCLVFVIHFCRHFVEGAVLAARICSPQSTVFFFFFHLFFFYVFDEHRQKHAFASYKRGTWRPVRRHWTCVSLRIIRHSWIFSVYWRRSFWVLFPQKLDRRYSRLPGSIAWTSDLPQSRSSKKTFLLSAVTGFRMSVVHSSWASSSQPTEPR